jgi:hypothetical protein
LKKKERKVCFLSDIDNLRRFNPKIHDTLYFDDADLSKLNKEPSPLLNPSNFKFNK